MIPIKRFVPYFTSFILFALAWIAFQKSGWWCWIPLFFSFGFIPLAEFLLKREGEWSAEKMQSIIEAGKERTIVLKHSIPVHITYLTCWVFLVIRLGPDVALLFFVSIYTRCGAEGSARGS